ncbi:MAG: hypothetical protein P4M08_14555 [Oligoflexia bacterium]|nr:hypothetical protein [Oligoflexia bacterium]
MSFTAIWIDRENAKLFHFSNSKMERVSLRSRHQDHHTHPFDQLDHQQQDRKFFAEIATHLADSTRVLILGPGVAKHHFQNYLVEQLPAVAKTIVGCETVDHPTGAQIAALAQKFFNLPTTL